MNILFTICGRAGSKGIKNKNLRMFNGEYLAYYTVSAIDLYLKNHIDVEYCIVANSDSTTLLELIAQNALREVDLIKRDENLAGDFVGKIEVIKDCLKRMEFKHNCVYDMVVDLDITSPLRTVHDLEEVINVQNRTGADVTTTVTSARRNPYFNQVIRTQHGVKKVIESHFTARQQAPEVFDMNASIYAYKPDYLKTGKGVLDGHCEIVEMYDTGILDLDHENDFELMEVVADYLFSKHPGFGEIRDNINSINKRNVL